MLEQLLFDPRPFSLGDLFIFDLVPFPGGYGDDLHAGGNLAWLHNGAAQKPGKPTGMSESSI